MYARIAGYQDLYLRHCATVPLMENEAYKKILREQNEAFESICSRCGACCGSMDDPCTCLVKAEDGKYYCKAYADRFGPRVTLSGAGFNCVSIREHIKAGTLRACCSYRRYRA